ncbi:hypothetical protein AMECASPLE_034443 [Ameca splendens]|uniref:Uncharacterized protein n=1 Tax=Ameca splendens TaxID=208324 RepID=A0ABV0XK79_9TELE
MQDFPWPLRTPPIPGFLPQQPPEPHAAWTAGTHHLLPESHRPKRPERSLLQPDSIPHCRCPPAGLRIAVATGTNNLATTAPVIRLSNGGMEHGPLGLNVPHLPRNVFEALPEVRVEAPPHGSLRQAFPVEPQDSFVSARSD